MALVGREKSMGFVWFLVASLTVGVVAWTIYDEGIGRRTWKQYAAEWEAMETKRLEAALQEAQKGIKPED